MKLNISFKDFKKKHLNKKSQIIYTKRKCSDYSKIENLFKFILAKENSFIFESVEKGKIRGRYTIIGLNPDIIWDIKNGSVLEKKEGKVKKINVKPLIFLNKVVEKFNIEIPKKVSYYH